MTNQPLQISICPYCEMKIRFKAEHQYKRAKCRQCGSHIRLIDNQNGNAAEILSSQWRVKVPNKLIFSKAIGPISEIEFLKMFESGQLNERCEVKSRRYTNDQWIIFNPAIMPPVAEEAKLKQAELARLNKAKELKRKIDSENKSRLRRYIQQAISDGQLSSREDSAIELFASKAKLDVDEVQQLIKAESEQLVRSVLAEALEDGILAPDEEEKFRRYSKGLGVQLNPTPKQSKLIVLSRHAYELNMQDANEHPGIKAPFKLQKNERCIASDQLEWNEVVQLKRPQGIPLGNGRYLKQVATGICYLTNKRVLLESDFDSKKATNSSVLKVACYRDGVFLNRSTGKSIFLRFLSEDDLKHLKFALSLKRILVGDLVQGFLPDQNFVPEQNVEDLTVFQTNTNQRFQAEPRFTFRVVGDHIGDRSYWIKKLKPNEPLKLIRESNNPVDKNAVSVYNQIGKHLGYLKREVAAWFAPLLDHGGKFEVKTLRIRDSGCLIIAVFD